MPSGYTEQGFVQAGDQRGAVAAEEQLDEHAADHVAGAVDLAQPFDQRCALAPVAAEEGGCSDGCRPEPVLAAERVAEGGAQLLGAERLVLEERELPAVERFRELLILLDDA